MESDKSGHRNILDRLRNLSVNSRKEKKKSKDSEKEEIVIQNPEPCMDRKSSFRKSLRKAHIRVKKVFRQKRPDPSSAHIDVQNYNEEIDGAGVMANMNDVNSTSSFPCMKSHNNEIKNLIKSSWYWGPLSKNEASGKLGNTPDGTFLVRDSHSSDDPFTITYRSLGRTFHSRIHYSENGYSLFKSPWFPNVNTLVSYAMLLSQAGVYCYVDSAELFPNYPIRFLKPLSRNTSVQSLKHLSRFVIRQHINVNDISSLPLPAVLYDYLKESSYF